MMGTEIFKIDAPWAEKLTKTRVQFLLTPTVIGKYVSANSEISKFPSPSEIDGCWAAEGLRQRSENCGGRKYP